MKRFLLSTFLIVFALSCKDESPSSSLTICGVKDPVRNLPWMKQLIDESRRNKEDQFLTLTVATLKGETVINYSLIHMSCIGCVAYHCDGSRVDFQKYTDAERQEFVKSIYGQNGKKALVIWPEK